MSHDRRSGSIVTTLGAVLLGCASLAPLAQQADAHPVARLQVTQAPANTSLTPVGSPFSGNTYTGRTGDISQGSVWSAAAVADVTGDGTPDIVTSGLDGFLRVLSTTGQQLAYADLGLVHIFGSPAIGDVSGDGVADVTVGTDTNTIASFSFTGGRTTLLFSRTEPARVQPGPTGIFSTPALADLDGDGRLDIVTSSFGQTLDAFSVVTGKVTGTHIAGFPQWLFDTSWSSPAVGDIDGDGLLDIVVGGDCEGSVAQPCAGTGGGGYVWAFNRDGSLKWKTFVAGQTVWSSPTLVDLNNDGAQDVVVGTGLFWPDPAGRFVSALDGRNGARLWATPTSGRVAGSASVADVDGDGKPEIFITSESAHLYALRSDGSYLWHRCFAPNDTCPTGAGTFGGVALADIDGDGRIEAVIQADHQLKVYDAATGALETNAPSAAPWGTFSPNSTPSIASIGGTTYVFQTALGDANGNRVRDVGDQLVVLAWKTGKPLGAAPWPTFKGSASRSGAVALPPIDRAATSKYVQALYLDLLGRAADPSGLQYWTDSIVNRRLSRAAVANVLAGTSEWVGAVVTGFYRDTLGRDPDPVGLQDWVGQIQRGVPVSYVASAFYASQEYYQGRGGNTPSTWVSDLYAKLLNRQADPVGLSDWTGQLGRGVPRTTITQAFYSSTETLRRRVDTLYLSLLGRHPDPAGLSTWPPFILAYGDITLAAALTSSPEYYQRAQTR